MSFAQSRISFFRSPLFPVFMIVFVDVLGFGITLPVLPLYAQSEFRATAQEVALIVSVFFLAQLFAAPVLGRMSDRFGRRPILLLSQSGTFAALALNAAATSLGMIYVARVIDGTTGGNISVAQAYLSDITTERNRAAGLGIINAAFGAGFVFGPAFGALMASHFGPRVPFVIAAGVSLLTIALTYFLLPESHTAEKRSSEVGAIRAGGGSSVIALFRQPTVMLILVVGFLGQFAFFSFQSVWVLWAEKVLLREFEPQSMQQIVGGILSLIGITTVLAQAFLIRPVIRRFGEKLAVAGGTILRGAAWLLQATFPVLAVALVTGPLMAIGGSVLQPSLIALLTYAVPSRRGQVIGLYGSFGNLGNVLGPLLAGALFERVNPTAPIAAAAAAGFLQFGVAVALLRLTPAIATPVHGTPPSHPA